jgi:hypothetical protein
MDEFTDQWWSKRIMQRKLTRIAGIHPTCRDLYGAGFIAMIMFK